MAGLSRMAPPGPGRTLAVAYAVFALAAGARSIAQIATDFSEAPVPYALSAFAACVYLVLALTIGRPEPGRRQVALAACLTELVGVIAVGAWSVADPPAFADETVWSEFGSGYLFLPLVLPCIGLVWLRSRARAEGPSARPGT